MLVRNHLPPVAFTPVEIILESREEVEAMYHLLNLDGGSLDKYVSNNGYPINVVKWLEVKARMWEVFNATARYAGELVKLKYS